MIWRKIFRRSLISCLIAVLAFSAAIVGAKIQMYTVTGEDFPSVRETQDIPKKRALENAVNKAKKRAGEVLLTYSRSINSELTEDEVTAITSNRWKIVGEPKYSREIINHSADTQIIVWKVTVDVSVDDSEIQSWIKRDEKEKSTIISQTREAQKASEENARQIKDLREQYNRATSQAERDRIIKQMEQVDRDFLANQKLEEGLKLDYAKDYHGAIKLYNEAIELKPDYAEAYYNRGNTYKNLRQYEQSIQDYNKAIELKPNYADAYNNRGNSYRYLNQDEQAIQDFNKALKFKQHEFIYANRGMVYEKLKQYERAIKDYDKAIKLNPNFTEIYNERGNIYMKLKLYKRAIQDYTKVISLNSNLSEGDLKLVYYNRGFCYQYIGEEAKAQADFAKAKELGYKG